jgi:hypothetical protein
MRFSRERAKAASHTTRTNQGASPRLLPIPFTIATIRQQPRRAAA